MDPGRKATLGLWPTGFLHLNKKQLYVLSRRTRKKITFIISQVITSLTVCVISFQSTERPFADPSHERDTSLSTCVLGANPFPEVTDLVYRLPLPTLFCRPEAFSLGDLLRLTVRPDAREEISLSLARRPIHYHESIDACTSWAR